MKWQIGSTNKLIRMKYKINKGFFTNLETGEKTTTIVKKEDKISSSWIQKQEASYDEYEDTHEGEYPEDVIAFFKYYRDSISYKVIELLEKKEFITILDIGCGTSNDIPFYVPISKYINYIGLDPIEKNLQRKYPFICSRLEDASEVLEKGSIDIFLFSTSLDHFEDINIIHDLLKPIASADAYVISISGMHDIEMIAGDEAKKHLSITNNFHFRKGIINKVKYLNRLRIFSQSMLKHYAVFSDRKVKLDNKIPLDKFHFYYFQYKQYHEFMSEKMGKMIDERIIEPGGIVLNINKL